MGKFTSGVAQQCFAFRERRAQGEPLSSGPWLSFVQQLHCSAVMRKGLTDGRKEIFSLQCHLTLLLAL